MNKGGETVAATYGKLPYNTSWKLNKFWVDKGEEFYN